ncbi:MAG: hypothetical protein LBK98_08880 [Peptococcaceae bacterium]|nr:hypothetical protein [Peptococcaceae bacterium]
MGKFKYKTQMYKHLHANIANIYAEAKEAAKKIGIADEVKALADKGLGQFGLTGGVSGCPAPLRDDVLAFSEKEAKSVKGLAGYVEDIRYMVKDVYGDGYDACPVNTCEAGIWTCYTSMFAPPVQGPGESYRARYIAPLEKHMHHQAGYGRPFPAKYKDIVADRGSTAGELGMMGKRQYNLDTVIVPLAGARYDNHGIKHFPVPMLADVKGEASRATLEANADRHAPYLTGFTSIGYETPGYGYGDKDKEGTPILQKVIADIAKKYNVPYVVDCAWGLPFVGHNIVKTGADAIVYSMDKATGSSLCGLIIGKEDVMVNARRAMGMHGDRYGSIASYGKAVNVAFDPGKEALCGCIAALKVLKDNPKLMTEPVDQMYDIIVEEFKALDPAIKDGFIFTKSYNSCAVEINYEHTWKAGKMGVPIFSIEDMYANTNIFQSGVGAMGMVPTIAYDGNIYVSTGLNTLDDKGALIPNRMRLAIKGLVALINITSKYAGICD